MMEIGSLPENRVSRLKRLLRSKSIVRILESQQENIMRILGNLVEEQKIGLLLRRDAESSTVMHAGPSYDITLQLTERLNQIK